MLLVLILLLVLLLTQLFLFSSHRHIEVLFFEVRCCCPRQHACCNLKKNMKETLYQLWTSNHTPRTPNSPSLKNKLPVLQTISNRAHSGAVDKDTHAQTPAFTHHPNPKPCLPATAQTLPWRRSRCQWLKHTHQRGLTPRTINPPRLLHRLSCFPLFVAVA